MGAPRGVLSNHAKVHIAVLGHIAPDAGTESDDFLRPVVVNERIEDANQVLDRIGRPRRQMKLVDILKARGGNCVQSERDAGNYRPPLRDRLASRS